MNFDYKSGINNQKERCRNINDSDSNEEDVENNDQSRICSEELSQECISIMERMESPVNTLYMNFGNETPIFSESFLQKFINYFQKSIILDLKLFQFIVNGPIENSTRLCLLGYLKCLYSFAPQTLPLIAELLEHASYKGRQVFVETGGIYILCYFVSQENLTFLISNILYRISKQEFDYFDDILPPNAFFPINCPFDTEQIFEFENFITRLISVQDSHILFFLFKSLINIFHRSEKAIAKLGSIVLDNIHTIFLLLTENNNYDMQRCLIEIISILSDNFDIDAFKIDLIQSYFHLITNGDYKIKTTIIPSFLSIIYNLPLKMVPDLINANIIHIFEELAYLENNKYIPDLIDSITDIASKVVMIKYEHQFNLNESLDLCFDILQNICGSENEKHAELAEDAIMMLQNICSSNKNDDDD
ncbi:hypothetical protein TRFO_01696 [Tritrichomonas foetus]|uniref:Uncharacterized protein n=1 Tax=Tritrichomonas foetus TaxID=1144522 RepID=A0A1J4JUB3_9EUKA|nr:hypothetical protein TRFO_01696 [Tritrichomonas foetus]|eukprot:OHT01108.1 hypothetical protein TRFO_01696 [Tritrichomonas foetus]